VFLIRHVGGDDPEMVIADPEYYMIHVVTYKAKHEQGQGSSSGYDSIISPALIAKARSSVEMLRINTS